MRWPTNYIGITQGFHQGKAIDIGWSSSYGGKNQPIYACADGVVEKIETQTKGGLCLYIKYSNGVVSQFAHLLENSITVNVGEKVFSYQQVAKMGKSGTSATAEHLHFALGKSINDIYKEICLNPFDYCEVYPDQIVGDSTAQKYDFKYYDEENGKLEQPSASSDLLDLVKKTIRGDFGNGEARKKALGDRAKEVQEQVNLNYKNGTTQWNNIKIY